MIDYTLPLDELPDPLPIEPLKKPFDVTITPPGSKSITCRAYVLAAINGGWVLDSLVSEDTEKLRTALEVLGAKFYIDSQVPSEVFIEGAKGRYLSGGNVNLGDGGTPARFMLACACLAEDIVIIDGSERMRERPIAEGVHLLRALGADIDFVEAEDCLPCRVNPVPLMTGGSVDIGKTFSSQFISAAMLIAPQMRDGLKLHFLEPVTSRSYVELTAMVMREYDIEVELSDNHVIIPNQKPQGVRIIVESDATSATYWLAAASISYSARVRIPLRHTSGEDFTFWQGDWDYRKILESMGANIQVTERGIVCIADGCLKGIDVDMSSMPDAALTLAVQAAIADGTSTITGLHTLRVKETDRIAALANELTKIGCTVTTTDDSITIDPSTLHNDPVIIETYNDHRMAMAFAVLGLARPGISISNPKCVAKSYPGFWKDFALLYA